MLIYQPFDEGVIKEMLAMFLQYNMLNIKIISYRNMTQILDVRTWFPFKERNCALKVTNLEPIGRCEYQNDTFEFTELPVSDEVIPAFLPGCKLRIATSIQEPYVYYNQSSGNFSGLEVMLVRAIAKKMQMIPEFILIKEVRSNRVVDNVTGIYSLLFQR